MIKSCSQRKWVFSFNTFQSKPFIIRIYRGFQLFSVKFFEGLKINSFSVFQIFENIPFLNHFSPRFSDFACKYFSFRTASIS